MELSKAASSILFHILETPTSLLMRGTSLSTLGSCQLQDLQHVATITKSLLMRGTSLSTLGSCQLQDLQNVGNIIKSLLMRSNSLSTLGSCQLQDLQHVATITKSLLMRGTSLSTLGSCQLQDLQHVATIIKSMSMRSTSLSNLDGCQLQDLHHVGTKLNHCSCAAIHSPPWEADSCRPYNRWHPDSISLSMRCTLFHLGQLPAKGPAARGSLSLRKRNISLLTLGRSQLQAARCIPSGSLDDPVHICDISQPTEFQHL